MMKLAEPGRTRIHYLAGLCAPVCRYSYYVVLSMTCFLFSSVPAVAQLAGPPGGAQSMSVPFTPALPGVFWMGATLASHGLGYDDGYYSVGTKQRLREGRLGGRWLTEVHGHVSAATGKPFANFGLERNKWVKPLGLNFGLNAWFDIDDDQLEYVNQTFTSFGVGGNIKTQIIDWRINGYIPVGDPLVQTTDRANGGFYGHHLLFLEGIDSALQGFDTEVRWRPARAAMIFGWIDVGGYHYKSHVVDPFGGMRLRIGCEPVSGVELSFELNNDSRFDTTGFLRATVMFGGRDRVHGDYTATARDLERTMRNHHIARYRQEAELAIDPDTDLPYVVLHVDNTVNEIGDGSFEKRYGSLLEAENASQTDDIIFVWEGDGTTTNMDAGIVLKDRQFLLGDGVEHLIPVPGGTLLTPETMALSNNVDGILPVIENLTGGNVVTEANDNVVFGIIEL